MKNNVIVYIVSDVRSGSTLLENIISKSKEVVSVGELHHLDSHLHKGKWGVTWNWNCSCGESFYNCEFWNGVFTKMDVLNINEIQNTEIKYTLNPTLEEIRNKKTTLKLLDRIYKAIFEVSNVNVIVDSSKNPQQGISIYKNSQFVVKVIYLKRDIRAVTISKNKWNIKFYSRNINSYKVLWKTFAHRIRCNKILKGIDDEDIYNLKYEDFSKDPQNYLDEIATFVGFKSFAMPKYMMLVNDHTIGGTPKRFEKRKIQFDELWMGTTRNKPIFNFIGLILNKIL